MTFAVTYKESRYKFDSIDYAVVAIAFMVSKKDIEKNNDYQILYDFAKNIAEVLSKGSHKDYRATIMGMLRKIHPDKIKFSPFFVNHFNTLVKRNQPLKEHLFPEKEDINDEDKEIVALKVAEIITKTLNEMQTSYLFYYRRFSVNSASFDLILKSFRATTDPSYIETQPYVTCWDELLYDEEKGPFITIPEKDSRTYEGREEDRKWSEWLKTCFAEQEKKKVLRKLSEVARDAAAQARWRNEHPFEYKHPIISGIIEKICVFLLFILMLKLYIYLYFEGNNINNKIKEVFFRLATSIREISIQSLLVSFVSQLRLYFTSQYNSLFSYDIPAKVDPILNSMLCKDATYEQIMRGIEVSENLRTMPSSSPLTFASLTRNMLSYIATLCTSATSYINASSIYISSSISSHLTTASSYLSFAMQTEVLFITGQLMLLAGLIVFRYYEEEIFKGIAQSIISLMKPKNEPEDEADHLQSKPSNQPQVKQESTTESKPTFDENIGKELRFSLNQAHNIFPSTSQPTVDMDADKLKSEIANRPVFM